MGSETFFGHPRGLATLFFTEMWERFSYYGMRALLILFMTASTAGGGLGFDLTQAGAIYGLYTSGVYLLSLPGGWIADRILGQRRAVLYGGVLIAIGQFCLAVPGITTFYCGLVTIVCGVGLLKPNVSTMVGKLYAQGDVRRDAGFSIFYMGINLGAFVAPLICGYVGERIDWRLAFALAGVGMVLGLVQYTLGGKHLGDAGLHAVEQTVAVRAQQVQRLWLAAAAVVIPLICAAALSAAGMISISVVGVANAFGVLLLVIVVALFLWLFLGGNWTPVERKRLIAIGVLFLAASFFWAAFEQAGSTLNLFAERSTRKSLLLIPFTASQLQSMNAVFIILLAPVFAWIWLKLGKREPSSPTKFVLGLASVGLGFALLVGGAMLAASGAQVSAMWLIGTYLLHTIGELCLSPVGLSAMTKLAPASVAGLMMGVWFLSNAVGNYLGGRLASFYEAFPLPQLFGAVAAFGLLSALALALFVRPMVRMMGGVR